MTNLMYSIIIPVYNSQEYLETCLQSCEKQWSEQVEVICINDGSSDRSKEILDVYAAKHSNMRVIHKENEGVSIARNEGLKIAKGRYVMFLDSDDLLEDNCLEMLDKCLENHDYDMIIGRTREAFNVKEAQTIHNLKAMRNDMNLEEARTAFISANDNLGIWAVWRHVFRREFIKENSLLFNSKYSFAEDMDFIIRCLLVMKSYTLIDFPLVKYRIYEESVSGRYTLKSALSNLLVLSYWRDYFRGNNKIASYFANKQLAMLPHLSHLSDLDKKEYFKEYQIHSKDLNKASGRFKLVYMVSQIVGYQAMSKWLG